MDQIHLLPPRDQQKGAKAMAATWQAGGYGQRTSQRILVAPRKPSPSISRAGKPLAEKEADDADEGKSSERMLAQDSPPATAPGYLPHALEVGPRSPFCWPWQLPGAPL